MSALKKKSDGDNRKNCDTKPIFLFCGKGISTTFLGFTTSSLFPLPPSTRIAEVTVDARGIDKPVVEIEFSSIVSLLTINDDEKASLGFFLFRSCDDGKAVVVNSWPYEAFLIENVNNTTKLSTSFAFNFCECLNTSGCFKYFVVVFAGDLTRASIGVNNVHIAALVGESGC